MNILMNILWIILGGLLVCLEYIVASLLLMITIIGIPFGLQTIKLAMLALLPFGAKVQSTPSDGGCLNVFMNLLWILLGVAVYHSDRNTFRYAAFQVGWTCLDSLR